MKKLNKKPKMFKNNQNKKIPLCYLDNMFIKEDTRVDNICIILMDIQINLKETWAQILDHREIWTFD